MNQHTPTQSQFDNNTQNRVTTTRRSYLIGLSAGIGAFAGCLGRGGSPEASISIQIETSDQFDNVASASDPELSVTESDGDDEVTIEYTIDVGQEECVNAEIDVEFRDENGVILDEFSALDTFEPAETYRVDHGAFISTGEVEAVIVTVHHDSLSARCFV